MLQLHSSVSHEKDVGLDGLYLIWGGGDHSKSRNEKMRKWEESTSQFKLLTFFLLRLSMSIHTFIKRSYTAFLQLAPKEHARVLYQDLQASSIYTSHLAAACKLSWSLLNLWIVHTLCSNFLQKRHFVQFLALLWINVYLSLIFTTVWLYYSMNLYCKFTNARLRSFFSSEYHTNSVEIRHS